MLHIFTYGSLMFAPVWSTIVRGNYRSEKATIYGYKRVKIQGQSYPALLPCTDSTSYVEGVIYYHVTDTDAARLDQFEGEPYVRQPVAVELAGQDTLNAQVYVWRDAKDTQLSEEYWDVEEFKRHGLAQFIKDYAGFNYSQ